MLVLPGSPALSNARFQLLAAEIAALEGDWQDKHLEFLNNWATGLYPFGD